MAAQHQGAAAFRQDAAPVKLKPHELARWQVGREVNAVSMSPDAQRLVVGLQDHSLQVWDLEMQAVIHVMRGHKYWVNDVVFCLDGVHVASGSADKTIKIWNAREGSCEGTLHGHLLAVSSVAFSEDAMRLASGSWDKTVCIWDVERQKSLMALEGHSDWVHSVAWSPSGRQLASASSDHSVRVWNAVTGAAELVLVGHLQTVSSVSFSGDGVFLASGSLDRTVRVWNLQDGVVAARLQQDNHAATVRCVAFVPDGERVVVGCGDRSVKVWSFKTGDQEGQLHGHDEPVNGVCVSLDGLQAASCSSDMTVRVWRLPTRIPPASLTLGAATPHRVESHQPQTPSLGNDFRQSNSSTMASFKQLHERLRSTEDTNQGLRQQLSDAEQTQSATAVQERELDDYRRMVSSLTAEKDKLEKSFEEVRRELRQMPSSPAGADTRSKAIAVANEIRRELRQLPSAPAGADGARKAAAATLSRPLAEPIVHSVSGYAAASAAAFRVQQPAGSPGGGVSSPSPGRYPGANLEQPQPYQVSSPSRYPLSNSPTRSRQSPMRHARQGYPLGATVSTAPGTAGCRPRRSCMA